MGLIADGAVSGVLPEAECFTVHYPGYPSSIARAVETLGSLDEIAKKRSYGSRRADIRSENRNEGRLEIRFRPEDPYCHPVFGDLRNCRGLLLKISKKKKKKRGEEEMSQSQEEKQKHSNNRNAKRSEFPERNEESSSQSMELSASMIGRVHQGYYFDGLADYQFVVPVHAARAKLKKRRWADVGADLEPGDMMDVEQDELIMLVPKLFSPKDIPDEILLKQSASSTLKQQQQHQTFADHSWEMGIAPCLKLSFEISNVPEKVNWGDNIPKDSCEWRSQMSVSMLFDKRPIWPRWSLIERLHDDGVGVSYNQLRRLLTRSGYYFSTGPFGQFWIKKGYDPRSDSESRIYQKVEFRLRDLLASFCGVNAEYGVGDFDLLGSNQNLSGCSTQHMLKQTWKAICHFQEFPLKSCTLQLCELDDEYIQEQISGPPQRLTCTHSAGWFSSTTLELLSLRVKTRFLSIFPKKGAERILKSLIERFEKLKKLEALNRTLEQNVENLDVSKSPCPDTITQISRNSQLRNSDVGPVDDGEEGFAPREVDKDLEEEDEDELDEYDLQPEAGEDGKFSPITGSYQTGENINLSYLQELLYNKIVDGDEALPVLHGTGTDASDSEYQIFEQDSDGSDENFENDDGS